MTFDPEGHFSKNSSIFGLPSNMEAELSILPCPWEPTTSFKKGCKNGPIGLFEASKQMDLYHPYFKNVFQNGIHWNEKMSEAVIPFNDQASKLCDVIQDQLDNDETPKKNDLETVNQISKKFNELVYENSLISLKEGKKVGLVGGDHSCPFGLIKALSDFHDESFSIVHIDAHFDFRDSYQGFNYSHASIMHNVATKLDKPPKIFQLGIRDFCESELNFAIKNSTFLLDQEMQKRRLGGQHFHSQLESLFQDLDEKIYISFDIDGLSPEFCPNTGTPVPGGLSYSEAQFMIEHLHKKGHELIGFDLVEVSPNQKQAPFGEGIDEVTAVRLLYSLSCYALASN